MEAKVQPASGARHIGGRSDLVPGSASVRDRETVESTP